MSSYYRHRSKGGILIIPFDPSRGDYAAGSLYFALGMAFQHEVGDWGLCNRHYQGNSTFHSTIVA